MIYKCVSLDNEQQRKVQDLIKECERYDCSVIPVQFDHSLNYYAQMNSWFLYFNGEELIGVVSVFNPLADVAEISGCVKPSRRNTGQFSALLAATIGELKEHNIEKVLFVVDSESVSGMFVAKGWDLKCAHIEYLMKYEKYEEKYTSPVQLREAELHDAADFVRINAALFSETEEESHNAIMACLESTNRKQFMAEIDDNIIGICTLYNSGDKVTIYGLGISEIHQGKGYGYALVHSVFNLLKNEKLVLELEVNSLNEKAYGLYKKAGFTAIRTVNYYEKTYR